VTNEAYATQIARDWNTKVGGDRLCLALPRPVRVFTRVFCPDSRFLNPPGILDTSGRLGNVQQFKL